MTARSPHPLPESLYPAEPEENFVSFEILWQTLASGVLIGLIYALVAIGLTLIFGVMDSVNFAHGEFLTLGMYASFWMFALYALDPILTLPLTALMLFAVGVMVYRLVIRKITTAPMLSQIFTTFGLMILFRRIAQYFWKPDLRTVDHSIVSVHVMLGTIQLGLLGAAGRTELAQGAGHRRPWLCDPDRTHCARRQRPRPAQE